MVLGTLRNSMIFTARMLLGTASQAANPDRKIPATQPTAPNHIAVSYRQSFRVASHIREIKVVSGAALVLVNGEKQFVRKGHYLCFVAGKDDVTISSAYRRDCIIEFFA